MKPITKYTLTILSTFVISAPALFASDPVRAKELNIEGIKVIYKKTSKDVISVNLFVKGGNVNIPGEKQGLENFAFHLAAEGGTKQNSKDKFAAACEMTGTEISGSSSYDYGTIELNCIQPYWEQAWKLFVEAVKEPAFDENEFKIMQGQLIASAKNEESDPDQHLSNIAMKSVFDGRNYSKIPAGTSESLTKISLADIKEHYMNAICKSRVFIVVVGNVEEKDVIEKVKSAFGTLPKGTASPEDPRVQITKPGVHIEDRDIATNYLIGIMSAPGFGTEEGIPMQIGMNILYDRFFVELRTKRSLSYAPYATFNANRISNPYNSIYISTKDPKQSIEVMVDEINKVKKEGFTDKELSDKKGSFLTKFYMGQQTSSAQAKTLGLNEMAGSWKKAETYSDDVQKVSLKEVNDTFNGYTGAIRWTYLGHESQISKEDFKQTWKGNVLKSPY